MATFTHEVSPYRRKDGTYRINHNRKTLRKPTGIYIRRDFTRVWDANRKVLDLVFGK